MKEYESCNGQKNLIYQELLLLLKVLLKQLGRTYLILDALDECSKADHDRLVNFVQTIVAWSGIHLHVLVTSQTRNIFTKNFTSLERCYKIIIEEATTLDDIKLYLSDELASNSGLDIWKSESETIISCIVKKSAGMSVFCSNPYYIQHIFMVDLMLGSVWPHVSLLNFLIAIGKMNGSKSSTISRMTFSGSMTVS